MASNTTGITNELGAFEDWIEVYNPGTAAVNIAGYYISDDPLNALLFQVPSTNATLTTVPAGGYLRLWADNGLTLGANHLGFKLGKSGETVRMTAPNGTTLVDVVTFGAQSDNISYGRLPNGGSTFTTFTTPTPGAANVASNPGPQPTITNLFVNEVVSASSDYRDAEGKREDWLELYNANTTALNIGGLYLTDDLGTLLKWQIPAGTTIAAGGFYTVFADEEPWQGNKHTNFSLKKGGEKVIIVQVVPAGNAIVDSLTFPATTFGTSYGRQTNGSATKVNFGKPTPNASNNGGLLYLSEPVISLASGKYNGTQSVSITHPLAGTQIRYTLDGSYPNSNSPLYTTPISITSTKTLRACAFRSGYAQSTTADHAYLISVSHNIPIVYLTTDPKNLYDDNIGIYTDGTNGIQRYCAPYPVNWAQDWERPCNYKMFLPEGTMVFDVDGGVQIDGVCSRNYKLKSLGMDLKEKEYGDEKINYSVFPQRTHSNYQRLKLRNGGQDYERTGIRDMVNHQLLIGKIDVDAQAARPVLVYINGTYHGIQNLQEKFAEEYFSAIYDANEDSLDIIKSPGIPWNELKSGSFTLYNQLHAYMETADMNNDAQFAYFQSQVDMDEFINYWVAMIYMSNTDWPANNLTVWREKKAGKKWRYCVSDTDGSTNNGLSPEANPNANTFLVCNDANSTVFPNHKGSTLFLRKLLARPSFRNEFIQRTCSFIHLVYDAQRTSPIIDAAKALYQPNVPAHLALYAGDTPPAMGGNMNLWNSFVDSFKTFFTQRPVFMRQHLQSFYGLSGTYTLQFNYTAATNGDVFVNWTKMAVPYNYQGIYFKNVPLRVSAVAKPGYTFSHWLETGQTTATIEFSTNNNAATLTPIFTSTSPATLTIACPSNITATAPAGATSIVVNYSTPIATSTCTTGSVTTARTSGLASGTAFPVGNISVCYQANDGCGNTKSCCFTVTVNGTATDLCAGISAVAGSGNITVNGLPTNKIVQIQLLAAPIYNLVFTCEGNSCATPTMTIPNLPNGIYRVKVKLLESNYALICKKEINVTVTSTSNGNITLNCPSSQTVTAASGANSAIVNYVAPVGTSTCTIGSPTTVRISGPASGTAFHYDKFHFEQKYGIDTDSLDLLENIGDEIIEGENSHYQALLQFAGSNNLALPDNYNTVNNMMDIQNYTDYQIAEIYIANNDWIFNNMSFFRKRTAFNGSAPLGGDGRWRWLLWDLDGGFGLYEPVTHLSLFRALHLEPAESPKMVLMNKLLENTTYKYYFINRFADMLNTTFLSSRVIGVIDSMKNALAAEMPEHILRWERPFSMTTWNEATQTMQDFAMQRPPIQVQHILDEFGLAGVYQTTLNVSDSSHGHIKINTIDITANTVGVPANAYPWSGQYFQNIPIQLTAIAKAGYTFSHWTGASTSAEAQISLTPSQNIELTAHFVPNQPPLTACPDNLAINAGFENGLGSWLGNGVISNDTYSGTKALRINLNNTAVKQAIAAIPGATYTVSAFAKREASVATNLRMKFKDSAQLTLAEGSVNINSTTYTKYTKTMVAPPNTATIEVAIFKGATPGAVWADDFCVTGTSAPVPPVVSIICPPNITTTVPLGVSSKAVNYLTPVGTSTCATGITSTVRTLGLASGSLFPIGITSNCFRATDGCNLTKSCCFQVVVSISFSNSNLIENPDNEDITSPGYFIKHINMYPNPSTNVVYFAGGQYPPETDGKLTITDVYGREVAQTVINFKQTQVAEVPLEHLAEGVYQVRLAFTGERPFTQSLVVIR